MPRDRGGIGRTGNKRKKRANVDTHRNQKSDADEESPTRAPKEVDTNVEEVEQATCAAPRVLGPKLNVLPLPLDEPCPTFGAPLAAAPLAAPIPDSSPIEPPLTEPPPIEPPLNMAPAPIRATPTVLRLQGSVLAERAVRAAMGCEIAQTWLREDVDEPIGVEPGWEAFDAEARERHQDHRWDTYLDALVAIKERFPMKVCCNWFEIGACTHGTPCECGGSQAPWPWIIHHPSASQFCECHLFLRRHWVRPGLAGPGSSAELVNIIQQNEKGRFRPECAKEGYQGGCQCNVCYECSE